jgi:hypothetical protein
MSNDEEAEQADQDNMTQTLIAFLTATSVAFPDDQPDNKSFVDQVGELGAALSPRFSASGTPEEVSEQVSRAIQLHTVKLLASFHFLFRELAEIHDHNHPMTSAEMLQRISLNLSGQDKA